MSQEVAGAIYLSCSNETLTAFDVGGEAKKHGSFGWVLRCMTVF